MTQTAALAGLASGEATNVSALFVAPAATESGSVTADSGGVVTELDEANNTRAFELEVSASNLSTSLAASPGSAGPDAAVGLAVGFVNARTTARELLVRLEVLDGSGLSVELAAAGARVVVGPGASGFSAAWNTARRAPGVYELRATAFEETRFVAQASTTFEVLAEVATSALVGVDRGTYNPRETVVLLGRATNSSRNQQLLGASVTATFFDAAGVPLQSSTRQLPSLPPLGVFDLADAHVLSPMAAAGAWRAQLDVRNAQGALLATAFALYQVQVVASRNIVSQTTVQPISPIGPLLPVHVALSNTSSVALTNGLLSVELFDISGPQLFAAQSSASSSASVAAGATAGFDFSLATTGINPGSKLLVTRLDGVILERLRIEAIAVVDNEPPVIAITGVVDGEYSRFDVTPVVSIVDASEFTATIALDGVPFVSGAPVTAEAAHLLQVSATDIFGNSAFRQLRFTIDKTPPALTLSGVADGAFSRTPVTLTFSASDANPVSVTSTIDGFPFLSGDGVSAEGLHQWVVTAVDAAGNSATASRSFRLDYTPPLISVEGVAEGAVQNTAVVLTFAVQDMSPTVAVARLDGVAFVSGATVSAEGPHALVVTATDAAGNEATRSRSFTLDFTAPVITVSGVTEGQLSRLPLTIAFGSTDANPGTTTATLDGVAFTSGTTVSAEGDHALVVTATDAAGNSASSTIHFAIDVTPPVITITGVAEGQFSRTALTIGFSASDLHPGTVSAALDGVAFSSGSTVSSEGAHALVVSAADAAGNPASRTVRFTLDFTAPVVTISGVAEGASGARFTPVIGVTDSSPVTTVSTLDGASFVSDTTITAPGTHTLSVTATDAAGNETVRAVHFTVVAPGPADPTFGFAVCAVTTLRIENNARVTGDIASSGAMTVANSGLITGNAVAGGSLTLDNSARIEGYARYGGTFAISNGASVAGGALQVTPAPSPCSCSYDVDAELGRAQATNDNALLSGLSNGGLVIHNAVVTIPGGTFYLTSLSLQGTAQLKVAVGQQARLFVSGNIVIENNVTVGGTAAQSGALLVVSNANGVASTVQIKSSSRLTMRLYAPKVDLDFQNITHFTGAVVGKALLLENITHLTSDLPSGGGVPLVCP